MAVILGCLLASKLRGFTAAAASAWFFLIAISTVFTWQHHLVDVAAGAMLGFLCTRITPQTLRLAASTLPSFARGRTTVSA
jgi:membrane-associated phospholipid phosphatase